MNQWYRADNKKLFTKRRTFVVSAALLIALLFVISMPQFLTSGTHGISRSLVGVRSSIKEAITSPRIFFHTKNALLEEREVLQQEVTRMHNSVLLVEALRKENKTLRAMLGRGDEYQQVYANVVYRPPETLYDTLVVDAGANEGISVGDLVIVDSTVIGVVRKVLPVSSTVVLYSAPDEQTHATIEQGTTTIPILAKGKGSGNFIVEVPRDLAIEVGDIITLPTVPGYVFAQVGNVSARPSDSFQTLRLQTPINMTQIQNVTIFISHATSSSE
jgi:cell shape-determining protein MreC